MISVGIDVSKGKSTICAVRPYGEILLSPKDYSHTTTDLELLVSSIEKYDEEIHVIMEATGNYHLPVATYLRSKGFSIYIINPLEMKRYRCQGIRNPKTDRIDALIIAQYGIDFWYRKLIDRSIEEHRAELKLLGAQYLCICNFTGIRINDVSRISCPINFDLLTGLSCNMHCRSAFLFILLDVIAELRIHKSFLSKLATLFTVFNPQKLFVDAVFQ